MSHQALGKGVELIVVSVITPITMAATMATTGIIIMDGSTGILMETITVTTTNPVTTTTITAITMLMTETTISSTGRTS